MPARSDRYFMPATIVEYAGHPVQAMQVPHQ
jgi:hypothetical protein